jgi:hypothetical protein
VPERAFMVACHWENASVAEASVSEVLSQHHGFVKGSAG